MNQAEIKQALAAATQAQRAGRPEEAARLYHALLDKGGEHPIALNALGIQALGARDFPVAAGYFARAIAVDTRSPDLWMNLAHAHRSQGDDAGEREALEGALNLDQRHFLALVRMAELHERNGRMAQAAERWGGVLAMAPMIEERTPALEMVLGHAREVVTKQQAGFAAAIDVGLADARAGLSRADRRRADAGIDAMLGRRQIYANQPYGLHIPFLPADEYFERDHFPWLAEIEAKTAIIRAELEAVLAADQPGILPYVTMDPGTPENKWSPLDNKLDWGALHLWKNGARDDAVCARCPETAAILAALPLADIPGRAPTVFFSLLQPGTHLPAHTGVTNVRTVIHLPLIVPGKCRFRVGGETREWREGEAWAFDDTIDHEAWNDSDKMRAVLIFDTWNPYLSETERALIRAFYVAADANGYDVGAMEG
jgi:aspartyl/asparaginyl beta-hydroxylase (cupin superfamily)